MQIIVLTGVLDDFYVVDVEDRDKINVVKIKILKIMGWSSQKKISVSFNGTVLQDNLTLRDYKIKNETELDLAIVVGE